MVVIGSDFHLRSYWSSDNHYRLSKVFSVEYLIADDIDIQVIPANCRITRFRVNPLTFKVFLLLLDASLVKFMSRSSSFKFRVRRMMKGDYDSKLGFNASGVFRIFRSYLSGIPGFFNLLQWTYKMTTRPPVSIQHSLHGSVAPIVLCWAQSMEPATQVAINLAQSTSAISVFVFDNWDNLSSKAVLLRRPDYIVCFGEQSKFFAKCVHGQEDSTVFPLGSSRFDVYTDEGQIGKANRKSVLLAGSSIALEDLGRLELLEAFLAGPKAINCRDFEFSYRPHPVPQGLSVDTSNWTYKNIQLGSSSKRSVRDTQPTWTNQKEVATQLSKNKIVVAGPTTLILEALLSGCFVILPTFGSIGVRTDTKEMISNLEHLKGIDKLENLFFADSPDELLKLLETLADPKSDPVSSKYLDYFVTRYPFSFSQRLTSTLESL